MESLVEIDVGCGAVVDRQAGECDVYVHQANMYADRSWDLFA